MDEDAREGRTTRNLFRTNSDSTDSSSDDDVDVLQQEAAFGDAKTNEAAATIVRRILHVELEERTVGGSIEHRLWPAAEYLATFVLQRRRRHQSAATQGGAWEAPTSETMRNASGRSAALEALDGMMQCATSMSTRGNDAGSGSFYCPLKVLELGAGVGLTGLELASQMQIQILLTDLESALPLLRSNVERNQHQFARSASTVDFQKLEWDNADDIDNALAWYRGTSNNCDAATSTDRPILILGSDCVYWESLYQPLEATIAALLQRAAPRSMCLLAGMRRWKRDNHFYQHVLGKSSCTKAGHLSCVCIDEQVTRIAAKGGGGAEDERQVMRIYAVQWVVAEK